MWIAIIIACKEKKDYINNPFSGKTKTLAIAFIVLIIVISYSLFFYLQSANETDTRNSIFERQSTLQMQSTQALSQRVRSDLDSVMARLQGLTYSSYLQEGDFSSEGHDDKASVNRSSFKE